MWSADGTWERVFTGLVAQADADEELNRVVSVDSTVVRAHQHEDPSFDRETQKQCNTVERCINRSKQWRGSATRYKETAAIYLAGLHVASIFLWSAR